MSRSCYIDHLVFRAVTVDIIAPKAPNVPVWQGPDSTESHIVIKVLFVCTGNICRSPTADGIFKTMVSKAGMDDAIKVDSCGLSGYHAGEQADPRSREMAASRGYDLSLIRSRKITSSDYSEFDYILAMDDGHLADMQNQCPSQYRDKLELFLDYHPNRKGQSVPDPYYGGANGFKSVFDMIEETSGALLIHIREKHGI
ncbi:protein-tyrosine phosphatase [Thalassospira sp. 11-3]|jgi:protein-tyrosine phosphatase|nr:protein tyrosine phosphatase [Thalassospira sp. KO164]PXX26155.1 protein-tyrosine phosphatase [Thalassospira sp. 11-3]SED99022.1 protein tyrosine phosphatase [Thalassospira permensis]|tara:strand:- start:4760 stop:5356 length:597 start_codon:yes stop_codon:yes gene_type:complete